MFKARLTPQLGLIGILAAALFFIGGSIWTLDLGTARRMGPGAFAPDWLALATIGSGVAAFALLTPLLGVLPAVFLSVLFSSSANHDVTWLLRVVLALAVAIGVWVIFILGLQMPFVAIRGL